MLAIDDSSGAGWFIEVSTDQNGQFTVSGLPSSYVMLYVFKNGFVQPCAVLPVVTGSLALQVEVTSLSTLENLDPPRPQSARGISLTGVVFEIANGA